MIPNKPTEERRSELEQAMQAIIAEAPSSPRLRLSELYEMGVELGWPVKLNLDLPSYNEMNPRSFAREPVQVCFAITLRACMFGLRAIALDTTKGVLTLDTDAVKEHQTIIAICGWTTVFDAIISWAKAHRPYWPEGSPVA